MHESQGRARSCSLAESRRGRCLPPPAGHRSKGSGQGGSSEAEPSVQLPRGGGNDPVSISQAESQVQITMRPTVVPPLPPLPPGTYVQPRPCSGPKPGVSRRWETSSSQFQPRKQNNPRPPDTRMKPHRPQSSVAPAETGTEGGARDRRREGGGRARGRHAHRAESLRMLGEPAALPFRFPDAAVHGKG